MLLTGLPLVFHSTSVGGELVLVQVNWNTGGSTFVGVNSRNWTPPVMLGPSVGGSTLP